MRRYAWTMLLLLAACTGGGQGGGEGGLPPGTIIARFNPGGDLVPAEMIQRVRAAAVWRLQLQHEWYVGTGV